VRELRNVVQRAYVMAPSVQITEEWLPDDPAGAATSSVAAASPSASATTVARAATPASAAAAPAGPSITIPIGTSMAEAERRLILATLEHFHQQKERTAAALGVSLKTLYNRLKEYSQDKVDTAE
jgi:DNA-binding NtrC family response regulator